MVTSIDFFREKKDWSFFKDNILNNYLKPYINKILYSRRPLFIIDCFAGKGIFDDGNIGSPLIIAEHIKNRIESSFNNKNIKGIFIEKKYYNELAENLKEFENCEVYEGTYNETVETILKTNNTNFNIFLYIDPYGIKNLDFTNFKKLVEKHFYSNEILMNFNSRGFLREGARLLKYDLKDFSALGDEEVEKNSISNWNSIVDGDYWQEILQRKNNNEISSYQAEEILMKLYSDKMNEIYKYSVNIPIKTKSSNMPKYRMIYGTNHFDGLVLMVEEMNKIWKQILENQRGGQNILFSEEFIFPDTTVIHQFDLEEDIIVILKKSKSIMYRELLEILIRKYGISYTVKEYREKVKLLEEKRNDIKVEREPPVTETGRIATSWDFNKYEIKLSLK